MHGSQAFGLVLARVREFEQAVRSGKRTAGDIGDALGLDPYTVASALFDIDPSLVSGIMRQTFERQLAAGTRKKVSPAYTASPAQPVATVAAPANGHITLATSLHQEIAEMQHDLQELTEQVTQLSTLTTQLAAFFSQVEHTLAAVDAVKGRVSSLAQQVQVREANLKSIGSYSVPVS